MFRLFNCIVTEHDHVLVGLAALICAGTVISAFKTFSLALGDPERRRAWLAFTGLSAAAGIWATHFVAMLAYNAPIPVGYDIGLTATSFVVAAFATTTGFALCAQPTRPMNALGGTVIGIGIAAMHFTGMQAIEAPGHLAWDAPMALSALIIGVTLATASTTVYGSDPQRPRFWPAVILLVAAICSLHFTAMSALTVIPDPMVVPASSDIDRVLLAMGIAVLTVLGLGAGISAVTIEGLRKRIAGQVVALKAEIDERRRAEMAVTSKQAILVKHQKQLADLMQNDEIRSGRLEDAMRCLFKALAEGLDIDRAGGMLLDPSRSQAVYSDVFVASSASFTRPEAYATTDHVALLRQTSAHWIVTVDDTSEPNALDAYKSFSFVPTGIRAALQSPIIANGELVGFLTASSVTTTIAWTPEQRLFALSVANLAALVVERHQRLQIEAAEKTRAERLARQQDLLNGLMRSPAIRNGELDLVFGDITASLCKEMSADRVSVRLFGADGDEHVLTEVYVAQEDRVVSVPRIGKRRYPQPLSEMLSKGPIAVADCATDPLTAGFYTTDLEPRRIRAMLHAPVQDGGEIIGVVQCSTYDTPHHWLPEDLLLVIGIANLVALMTERRLRLRTEETLREANLVAEEANRAKSQFLANMSHEIRTPMNGVLGMTDLLLRSGLSERQHRFAATIGESARALLTIINDILDLSRIEGGKLELDPQPFELGPCVEDAVELLSEQANKKRLDLNLFIEETALGSVICDQVRLRQILVNLIGNAIKFTQHGEVSIHVGANTEGLRFAVRDTGIGIDPQVQAKLFQPFSQADTSITRRFGGTGLGLSISRHLVEMMGGTIRLDSTVGEGTTIAFTLPLQVTGSPGDMRKPRVSLAGRRILVIDDNATNREIISSYLAEQGALIETAENANAGIDRLKAANWDSTAYDLVIVDYKMAGGDGLEFARRVRANPSLSGTRLILLSSMSWTGDAAEARGNGFHLLLQKPIRRQELVAGVVDCLSASVTPGQDVRVVAATPAQSPRLGLRVLLAEDNPVNQVVAEEYLHNLDCTLVITENGVLALEALAKDNFDVVLMDCHMPEMDGYKATETIRALEQARGAPQIPVIAVTANAFEADRQRCLAAGMNSYLSKPYSEAQLAEALAPYRRPKACPAATEPTPAAPAAEAAAKAPRKAARPAKSGKRKNGDAKAAPPPAPMPVAPSRTAFAAKLMRIYLAQAPILAADLAKAAAEEDAKAVALAAHSLKSSSANVGEEEIAEVAGDAEIAARDGDVAGAARLAARITVLVAALEAREGADQLPIKRA